MKREAVFFMIGALVFGLVGYAIGASGRPPITERGLIACNDGDWRVSNIDFYIDFGSTEKVYRFFKDFCRGRA